MADSEEATPEAIVRATVERLKAAGVRAEVDPDGQTARGVVRLEGQLVANIWGGTALESIGFVTTGVGQVRLSDPSYLEDAPPISIDGILNEADLAARAAQAHDAWVGALTDLDADLARFELGHRLHASRGVYVAHRKVENRDVEFAVRPDGMVELLGVGDRPLDAVPRGERTFAFDKTWSLAYLEAALADGVGRLERSDAGVPHLLVRFRDREQLAAAFDQAISRGGLFVRCDMDLAVGQRVNVTIEEPQGLRVIDAEGEVVVVRGAEEATRQRKPRGAGILFRGEDDRVVKEVEGLLAEG